MAGPINQSNFFLRTKLLPPRPVSDVLKRPRLIERLRANANSPVTLVAADAGCGKTTLISDFLRDQTRPFVWYQLDYTDADPVVFLTYVANGIKNIQPDFGEALFPYLAESSEDVLRYPERAADLFINEVLGSIENPFVLVLDDYHHIGTETLVHRIVDRMLQYSAEYLHLIITTRDLPPLAIMRRRTQSAALVIDRNDLLFTDAEVRDLFRSTLKVELADEEIAEYRKRTHGWVTALQLVRQIAEKDGVGEDGAAAMPLTDILARSEKDIFDYFAEEVFAREDAETQNLLMHLSLLESLPLEACSLLFPQMRCSALLPELVQKNIFLTVAGERGHTEEYRFHPLFRDFLLRRMRSQIGQAGVAAERRRIASVYLENGRWEAALPFLLDAEDFDTAAGVIARHGDEWVLAGAITSLETVTDKIPAAHLEKHPRALLHRAEVARLQGNIDKSSALLHRVTKLFAEAGDTAGEAEALHSLASIARRRGRTAEALDLLETAEQLAEPGSQTILKCVNTRGLCFIQEGKWNEAEQQFRVALEHAEAQSDEQYIRLIAHNLALAPGFRGDFGEALRWFQRIFREDEPGKKFPHDAIGHLNVARLRLLRGELDLTEHHLERALELCQLFNLRSLRPEIFETYANYYRERGDFAHAAEFYERSANAYADAGIDLGNRELNEERAKFAIALGDATRARGFIESLVEAREGSGSDFSLNTAKLCLMRVDLDDGRGIDPAVLKARCAELLAFFHERNHYYYEAEAAMLLAEVCFRRSENPEMVAAVQRVLELSARFDYEYWLRGEIRRSPAIFASEDIVEKLPPDLRQELGRETPEPTVPAAVVSEMERPIVDLTVKVLGHVEIFRDPSKPFAADAWTTRRARDIFCYIATRKNRRAPKDVLIDAFWGGEDLDAIEKNFHPTISHIRKALNSRQTLKQNFIIFRDGSYQLSPEFSYRIDTEEFLGEIASAEAAKADKRSEDFRKHLENAVALYRGDFMEGLYEDWAEEQRTYFSEQFSRVLNALAKLSVTEKRWADAIRYANQILAIDPYREDLHRLVMRVLAAQGKPAAVKKHFEEMSVLLKQDLGIEPSAETRKVFGELMG
jgi:ATP/maltotriose-dependent transcriptional regulator MalT/DNA-binding SARP family transcriptional activator